HDEGQIPGKWRKAPAASAALRMLVTPPALSTAAVVRIIKNAMTLENTMPTLVSRAMRSISDSPPRNSSFKGPPFLKRAARAILLHLLDLLGRLPEEQVGTDGRPEHGNDHEQIIAVNLGSRPHCARGRFAPRNMNSEGSGHI